MPRLSPSLIRRAYTIDPLLVRLLPACRDLSSARNELRWLRDHALSLIKNTPPTLAGLGANPTLASQSWQRKFHKLVAERASGKPIQYVIGDQPFGRLEILCKPNVLIPRSVTMPPFYILHSGLLSQQHIGRPETESIVSHLAHLLQQMRHHNQQPEPPLQQRLDERTSHPCQPPTPKTPLHILDLCTGTGCIALHLHSLLSHTFPLLHIHGVDISPHAIDLAQENLLHNLALKTLLQIANKQVFFDQDNIFAPLHGEEWAGKKWDVLVSNPPYISPREFERTTSKGVRGWEPKGALVPPLRAVAEEMNMEGKGDGDERLGDAFYPRLLEIAAKVQAKVVLVEVADMEQAKRVAGMVEGKSGWNGWEIWRDWPGQGGIGGGDTVHVDGKDVRVLGEGNGRAVLAWRDEGGNMLGKSGFEAG